jgi:hypothetical protein
VYLPDGRVRDEGEAHARPAALDGDVLDPEAVDEARADPDVPAPTARFRTVTFEGDVSTPPPTETAVSFHPPVSATAWPRPSRTTSEAVTTRQSPLDAERSAESA